MFDDFYIQQISEPYDGREGGEMLLSGTDYQFFLSKNRIQDYVLGFQPLLDITEAKSEPSQPSGAGCTLSKWIHKIWILKTSNCPNEKDFALTSKITASETVPQSHLRLAIRRYTSKGPEQHEMQ